METKIKLVLTEPQTKAMSRAWKRVKRGCTALRNRGAIILTSGERQACLALERRGLAFIERRWVAYNVSADYVVLTPEGEKIAAAFEGIKS